MYHELLAGMDGVTVSIAAQAALETLPTDEKGKLKEKPAIRSDNGSCYISREFGGVLDEHELNHRRITPHCPEENGTMERANRTIDEALTVAQRPGLPEASGLLSARPGRDVRHPSPQTCPGPAPPERKEPAEHRALQAHLEESLRALTRREREVIRLRFGLADGAAHSRTQIGALFRLSRERIRQIEHRALNGTKKLVHDQCLAAHACKHIQRLQQMHREHLVCRRLGRLVSF